MVAPSDSSRVNVDGDDGWLTAQQVAEVLSVKRATVYAYVSRGMLHRTVALDGRTSLFERRQVEELRVDRRSGSSGELRTILSTSITRIAEGKVLVRGTNLVDRVRSGAAYGDIADLIWETDNSSTWPGLFANVEPLSLPEALAEMLSPLDRLRVAVAVASSDDPFRNDLAPSVVRRTGPRLIKAMVGGLGPPRQSRIEDQDPGTGSAVADALWVRLTERPPTPSQVRCLDVALALLADHELAPSTFAARVAASTRADPYAVVGAGLGALGGPLHGAASAGVHGALRMLDEGESLVDTGDGLSSLPRPMAGFGHSIYRRVDPRFALLSELITKAWSNDKRVGLVDRYQLLVSERNEAAANVDLSLGLLTFLADMKPEAGEVIFAISRTAGWIGHAMEEYQERPLRLRPKGHYIGPMEPQLR